MTDDEIRAKVQEFRDFEAARREAEKGLPLYRVRVRYTGFTDFFVRAASEEEADAKALERWEGGDEGQPAGEWDWQDEEITLLTPEQAGGQA